MSHVTERDRKLKEIARSVLYPQDIQKKLNRLTDKDLHAVITLINYEQLVNSFAQFNNVNWEDIKSMLMSNGFNND